MPQSPSPQSWCPAQHPHLEGLYC